MIEINTEKEKLDVDFIHNYISKSSYWAKGRTIEDMQTVIENSLCFGVYLQNQQIGFARLVTDYAQFAYIMDVFIDPNFRGKGYSKQLIDFILRHETLQKIKIWRLATSDAHGLYSQFGFKLLGKPETLMEILK
jgi:GNAT superfamily N-acetyltransferase